MKPTTTDRPPDFHPVIENGAGLLVDVFGRAWLAWPLDGKTNVRRGPIEAYAPGHLTALLTDRQGRRYCGLEWTPELDLWLLDLLASVAALRNERRKMERELTRERGAVVSAGEGGR